MARKNSLSTAAIVFFIGSLFLGSPAFANSNPSSDTPAPQTAKTTVEEYRELRRNCAAKTGAQQKSCFHELNASNKQYRVAKQQLQLGETDDLENIHLVTF